MYQYSSADGSKLMAEIVDAPTQSAYERVDAQVGKQRYSMPTGKPLLALLGGGIGLLIYWLAKHGVG
jgi:hypothetical protein